MSLCLSRCLHLIRLSRASSLSKPGELSLLRRYLLEYRAEPKIAWRYLIDDQSRIRKLCMHSSDRQQRQRCRLAEKYYRQPRRNCFKLGAPSTGAGIRRTGRFLI